MAEDSTTSPLTTIEVVLSRIIDDRRNLAAALLAAAEYAEEETK